MNTSKSKLPIAVVILLVAGPVIACSAFSSEPQYTYTVVTTTPPGPVFQEPQGKIGDTVTLKRFSITVTDLEEASEYGQYKPQDGYKFVAVEMTIESRADNGFDINPLYARLQDANGEAYFLTFGGKEPSLEPQFKATEGSKEQGWITFEVPQSAQGFVLVYEVPFSSPVERAVIDLIK